MIPIGAQFKKLLMISVVIPVRDACALLQRCLESLDRQTVDQSDYEVIVVDDGSSDGSAEVARKWGARVFRQEKQGAGAARNRGIQEAKGEVLLFLDADCEADREWMAKLSAPIGKDGTSGTIGHFTSDQENWVARLIQIEIEGRYHRMRHYDRIDFVNTATCGFRRELLLSNLFDESFQKLEDVELSFRLAQKGSRLVYVPGATVRHSHPEKLNAYLKRKFRYARVFPALYRRFPEKMLSDSSTPPISKVAAFASWFGSSRSTDFAVCELDSPAGIDRIFDAHDCESISEVDKAGSAFTLLCADRKYGIPAWIEQRYGVSQGKE